jgi:hypothetical protein
MTDSGACKMHPNDKINLFIIDIPLAESNKSVIFSARIAEPNKIFRFATKKKTKNNGFQPAVLVSWPYSIRESRIVLYFSF